MRFLKAGDKVKITIMFRGREQHRPELGFRLLQRLAEDVTELGFVESAPKQDGRNMIMVLGPHKKKAEAKVELKAAKEERMAERAAEAAEEAAERAAARAAGPVAQKKERGAPRTWIPRSRRDEVTTRPTGQPDEARPSARRPVGHHRHAVQHGRYDVRGEAHAEEQDALGCQQAVQGDRRPARSAACRRAGSPALRSRPRPPPAAARSTAATPGWSSSEKADVKRVKKLLGR